MFSLALLQVLNLQTFKNAIQSFYFWVFSREEILQKIKLEDIIFTLQNL